MKRNIFNSEHINYFESFEVNAVDDKTLLTYFIDEDVITEEIRGMIGANIPLFEKENCLASIAVIGYGVNTGNIYLLDTYKSKLTYMSGLNKINEFADKYHFFRLVMKKAHFEIVANEDPIRMISYKRKLWKEVNPDNILRFNIFSAEWSRGNLYINRSISQLEEFLNEILNLKDEEDNCEMVDVFCLSWEGVRKRKYLYEMGHDFDSLFK